MTNMMYDQICILKVRVAVPHKSPFVCLYVIWVELFLEPSRDNV